WITLDGVEIFDFSTLRTWVAQQRLRDALRGTDKEPDWRDARESEQFSEARAQAEEIVHRQGVYTQYEAYAAISESLSLSIDQALCSDDLLVRALAVLDRRLGKRRLAKFPLRATEHALVLDLLAYRCA